ncbi:MAG: hypothetical protein ACKN85_15495, partial [Pirellula sp.]
CHVSFDIRYNARSTGREQLVRWTMGSVLCDAVGRHACPVSNTGQIPGLVERFAGVGIASQCILVPPEVNPYPLTTPVIVSEVLFLVASQVKLKSPM